MPTTNFQQWNPSQANQESDSGYAGDSQRAGGAATNAIFPSPLANKLFYQLSTMVAAMAGYLNSQGQNAQDTDLGVLIAAIQAAIAQQIATVTAAAVVLVPFSNTPIFDASRGTTFEMTLTGNVTSSSVVNARPGQRIAFIIHQDPTGGRTLVWAPNMFGTADVDPTANATSVHEFLVETDGNLRPLTAMTVS